MTSAKRAYTFGRRSESAIWQVKLDEWAQGSFFGHAIRKQSDLFIEHEAYVEPGISLEVKSSRESNLTTPQHRYYMWNAICWVLSWELRAESPSYFRNRN